MADNDLAQESTPHQVVNQSGGAEINANDVEIGGDVIGRDKVTQNNAYLQNNQIVVTVNVVPAPTSGPVSSTGKIEEVGDQTPLAQAGDTSAWLSEKYYGQFVGHSGDLEYLLQRMSQNEQALVVAVTAMGGMGKTAFCRELVERAHQQKLFADIAWVRAKIEQLGDYGEPGLRRESRLSVEAALRDIAMELRLPHWQICSTSELKKQMAALFARKRCLIVIDGLEDAESPQVLSEELRQILGCSCALINSRQQVEVAATDFKLRKLDLEEAREFIRQVSLERYGPSAQNPLASATRAHVEAIIKATDGMPLALKLVISQAHFLDLDRIVQRLSSISEEKQLYGYIFEDSWEEMEKAGAQAAQQLLVLLASRGRPVPVSLMYGLQGLSQLEVDDGLRTLRNLSLVEYTHNSGRTQVGLHSLTRQFVNETLRTRYM